MTYSTAAFFALCSLCITVTSACVGLHGGSVPSLPSIPGGGGKSAPKGEQGCLHVDAKVLLSDGKSMESAGNLVIGDYVWGDNGSNPVVLTPTVKRGEIYSFIDFKTRLGYGTTITPHHSVFSRPCGLPRDEPWPIKRADDMLVGECVPTVEGGEDEVMSLSLLELPGKIHVITATGKIASGGVILSCYDHDHDGSTQEKAHAPFEPVRMMYSWAEKIYDTLSDEQYAQGILTSLVKNLGLENLQSK